MIDRRHLSFATKTTADATWPEWVLSGWLTVPDNIRRDELHVLVHGAGADHRYWDWPMEPDRYSYVTWATARGIATLNLDRIGCGHSSRPPGAEVTVSAQADGIAQVIDAMRNNQIASVPAFSRIVLVGHSIGSVICGTSVASHGGPDALVLTGYLPVDGTAEMGDELFDFAFVPAVEGKPELAGLVDGDYLVPREGLGVDELRFWGPATNPAVMAFDGAIKGAATKAELRDAALAGPHIRTVTAPTLALVGEHDALLIDTNLGESTTFDTVERVRKTVASTFATEVVPGAGHMQCLQRNAHDTYSAMERWLDATLPNRVG
ncbi:alpha/beta hydrolase [Mycobacterium sp. 48b]|uniref:alpha/beta hydrolase n=1 Tax=Mycobacterium sp. 48b TaxID=3400426 RepID=UPI003AAA6E56